MHNMVSKSNKNEKQVLKIFILYLEYRVLNVWIRIIKKLKLGM